MNDRWRFWDGLTFGFTASLMLWQDLPVVAVIMVLAAVFAAAFVLVLTRGTQ